MFASFFALVLYLPIRLIINSSTEELVAQIRKEKKMKERNQILILFDTESNMTQETYSAFMQHTVQMNLRAYMHPIKPSPCRYAAEREATMRT